MTDLRQITETAWLNRVEKALRDGYFARKHGAEVLRFDSSVVAQREILGWVVATTVTFDAHGATVAAVRVVNVATVRDMHQGAKPLTGSEAALLADLVGNAARSAEYVERVCEDLRVVNAAVVVDDASAPSRPVAPRPAPGAPYSHVVKVWGVCPVPGCGKLIVPRRTSVPHGYRPEWVGRYCDHGPFRFAPMGTIVLGCQPVPGQPATVQVGSDTYAAEVARVERGGKWVFLKRNGREEAEKAVWAKEHHAYRIGGSRRGLWVTIGEARDYRAPEV